MKYYQLGDVVYWADENTKIADGSVEISKATIDTHLASTRPPRTWQPREFMELFPIEKQLAIQSASRTNDQVGLWYSKFLGTNPIVEGSDLLQEGLQFMVQAGILTRQDIDNALTPKP